MYSYGPPHMAKQKQDDQLEHTYSSYVRIRDVALKTCQRRWTIGRSVERESGISVLVAWHDDEWYGHKWEFYNLVLEFDDNSITLVFVWFPTKPVYGTRPFYSGDYAWVWFMHDRCKNNLTLLAFSKWGTSDTEKWI